MPQYNKQFELTLEDVDLIETALRQTKQEMSSKLVEAPHCALGDSVESSVRQIHELLGRLHNQKVFYRPNDAYFGG